MGAVLHGRTENSALKKWLSVENVPEGFLEMTWMGQAGFLLRTATCCVAIDLYLSDFLAKKYRHGVFAHHRMMAPPIQPKELAEFPVDLLISTHAHSDHLDPETIGPFYSQDKQGHTPLYVLPRAEGETALQRGVPVNRLCLLNEAERFCWKHINLQALASAHETLSKDEAGNSYYLGFVIEMEGLRIYHSGDGIPYPGLAEELSRLSVDIALLPVNGRDSSRSSAGIPGNFTVEEACALVHEAEIPFFIPHHFHMFSFNTVDPEVIQTTVREREFKEDIDYLIPESGRIYRFSPGGYHGNEKPTGGSYGRYAD